MLTDSPPASKPRPSSSLSCPTSDGIIYSASGETFEVYCSVDYNSNADPGNKDLKHMEADTVDSCIDSCASDSDCVGAGWGLYQGSNVCWLKSQLGTSQSADEDWIFVIKQ